HRYRLRGDVIGRRQPQVSASAPLGRGAGPLRLNPPAAATAAPSLWWSRRGSTTPGGPVCGGRLATEAQSAAAETRHNGGAPKPLCVHGGLGAPPLCRLQVLAERGRCAAVSTLHRGFGHAPWSRQRPVVSAAPRGLGAASWSRPPRPTSRTPESASRRPEIAESSNAISPPVAPDLPNSGPQSAQSPQNPTAGSSERSSSKRPD